jgi:large subunit ribosomal protein L35Ae
LFPLSLLSFRLYVKGVMTGFKRGLRNQHEHTSLLKIQNVNDKASTNFYLGKRVCFIYKAQTEKKGSKYRTIWGRVTRAHGTRYTYPAFK